jgi:peptidyl-tRNA hydrolase
MTDSIERACLYVLVNLEYASMGAGRSAAQASHAANQFIEHAILRPIYCDEPPNTSAIAWTKEANGFGTQIVKAARNKSELESIVHKMQEKGFLAQLVIDPEYVIMDGTAYHVVANVVTAAFIFGDREQLYTELYKWPLLLNTPFDLDEQFKSCTA